MKQLFLARRTSPHYWQKIHFKILTFQYWHHILPKIILGVPVVFKIKSRLLNETDKPNILSSQICFPALSFIVFHLIPSELQPHEPFGSSNAPCCPPCGPQHTLLHLPGILFPLWQFPPRLSRLSPQPTILYLGRSSWSDYVTWYPNQSTCES